MVPQTRLTRLRRQMTVPPQSEKHSLRRLFSHCWQPSGGALTRCLCRSLPPQLTVTLPPPVPPSWRPAAPAPRCPLPAPHGTRGTCPAFLPCPQRPRPSPPAPPSAAPASATPASPPVWSRSGARGAVRSTLISGSGARGVSRWARCGKLLMPGAMRSGSGRKMLAARTARLGRQGMRGGWGPRLSWREAGSGPAAGAALA
jgi:hypothetical protein